MFLGICEHAAHVRDQYVNLAKWNLLGLKSVVLAHVYPLALDGFSLVMGIYAPAAAESLEVVLRSADGIQVSSFRAAVSAVASPGDPNEEPAEVVLDEIPSAWILAVSPAGAGGVFIPQPGPYTAFVRIHSEEVQVGRLHFAVVDPLPLTPERIAAIKADPEAAKLIKIEFKCTSCGGGMKPYAALERAPHLEAQQGLVWYQDLPDEFKCSCGLFSLDLRIAKRNMHGLLGHTGFSEKTALSVPLYERGVIDSVRIELGALVGTDPEEEAIQRYFTDNPLVLHMSIRRSSFRKLQS